MSTPTPVLSPEDKALWLEALRSGNYKKGRHRLEKVEEDGSSSFCCLGVLCKIKGWDTGVSSDDSGVTSSRFYDPLRTLLTQMEITALATRNDSCNYYGKDTNFSRLADFIEKGDLLSQL